MAIYGSLSLSLSLGILFGHICRNGDNNMVRESQVCILGLWGTSIDFVGWGHAIETSKTYLLYFCTQFSKLTHSFNLFTKIRKIDTIPHIKIVQITAILCAKIVKIDNPLNSTSPAPKLYYVPTRSLSQFILGIALFL